MADFEKSLTQLEQLVGVDSEATYGDDAFEGADPTDYLAFDEFEVDPEYGEAEDEAVLAVHSGRKSDTWGDYLGVSWTLPLTLAPAAGDPPAWAALLKSSNFEETIEADTSVTYKPVTGNAMARVPSATAIYYMIESGHESAYKWILEGLRTDLTIQLEMNEYARISGDSRALFAPQPSTTVPKPSNPTTYSGDDAIPRVVNLQATAGSEVIEIESLEIATEWDWGMDYQGANTPDGSVSEIHLVRQRGSNMSAGITLKARGHALETMIPELDDDNAFEISATLAKGGRSLDISMPRVQFTGYSYTGDNRKSYDLEAQLCGDFADGGGENDLVLEFT